MILYGASLSPFVRKTLAYAAEKGLTLELVPAGMGRGGPEFAEASPLGKMPAFRDPGPDGGKGFTIAGSSAIIHYLEAKYPEPNLIPASPADRARTIWWDAFGDTMIAKLSGATFFTRIVSPHFLRQPGDEAVAAAAIASDMPKILDCLESVAPDPDGFLVAGRLTLADLAVASPFVNLVHSDVEPARDRWPRAMAYVGTILARPSFAALVEEERQFLAATAA